jgi:uncharacterized membrane protein YedE/YeeE
MNSWQKNIKLISSAFFVGILFAIGLAFGGMLNPSKVIGFLDFAGHWDPSLLFVMGGAVFIHRISYLLVKNKPTPYWEIEFYIPKRTDITPQLIFGAVLFGTGWALTGFCPGTAIVSLATGQSDVFIFVISMLTGIYLYKCFEKIIPMGK